MSDENRTEESEAVHRNAWCFDHGRVHHFDPEGLWCTARWVYIDGDHYDEVAANKRAIYGDAVFLHDLTDEQQLVVIREAAVRREGEQ